jgi:hypothetical protein
LDPIHKEEAIIVALDVSQSMDGAAGFANEEEDEGADEYAASDYDTLSEIDDEDDSEDDIVENEDEEDEKQEGAARGTPTVSAASNAEKADEDADVEVFSTYQVKSNTSNLYLREQPSHDSRKTGRALTTGEFFDVRRRIVVQGECCDGSAQCFLEMADGSGYAFESNRKKPLKTVTRMISSKEAKQRQALHKKKKQEHTQFLSEMFARFKKIVERFPELVDFTKKNLQDWHLSELLDKQLVEMILDDLGLG